MATSNTTTTQKNAFYNNLISLGIKPNDAMVLEKNFSNEPDFEKNLELISSWMASKKIPTRSKPKYEPWLNIYDCMMRDTQAGIDIDSAFSDSLSNYPNDVQIAITKAVGIRMKVILDFENNKKNKSLKRNDFIYLFNLGGFFFKFNTVTGKVEVNGEPLTDVKRAELRSYMRDNHIFQIQAAEDAYLTNAWENRYHPIQEYFKNLSGWDGRDYYSEITSCFVDKTGHFQMFLRRWAIGAIAKVFQQVQNIMLILDGDQGIGKSDYVAYQCPPSLTQYRMNSSISPDDKDSILRLTDKWICEVPELGAVTRRADYEALKAFLTRTEITVRRPYGKYEETLPVLASFIGTFNNSSGLLNDLTGSRRFIICKIESIDWSYSKIPIDMFWSQMYAEYLAGEPWNLTQKEHEISEKFNREFYEIPNPIEDILTSHYAIDAGNRSISIPTRDVLEYVKSQGYKYHTERSLAMEIAATLKRYGVTSEIRRNMAGKQQKHFIGMQ